MRRPQIELLETGQSSPFWAALYAIKARAQRTIAHILPEPHAALLTGILLGVEPGIPRDLYDRFNATGTSHPIVISSFNKPVTQIDIRLAVQTACWGASRWMPPVQPHHIST